MKTKVLPITTIIKKAFKLIFSKQYLLVFVLLGLAYSLFSYIASFLFSYFYRLPLSSLPILIIWLGFLLSLILYFIFFVFSMTFLYYFGNEVVFERKIFPKELLFKTFKSFFNFLKTFLVFCLIVVGGIFLLIIPGIYWGVKFFFAPIVSVLDNKGVKESLNTSRLLTKSCFWSILVRLIIFSVISSAPGFLLTRINPNLNFLQSFFTPASLIFYLILYYQLKAISQR